MDEFTLYKYILYTWFFIAVAVFILLLFITAPYGRFIRKGWGIELKNSHGWIVMELPSLIVFSLCFLYGSKNSTVPAIILFTLWVYHYFYRSFIYPFTLKGNNKMIPVTIVLMGVLFNIIIAWLNGRFIFEFSEQYNNQWLYDSRFVTGVFIFITGHIINRRSDMILRQLRKNNESGYKIPYGGLYHLVSSPNYFGEIVEWTGWAIATWSWPGFVFAVWTFANLAPRARANHLWYQEQFKDYPKDRKMLIPGLW